MMRILHLSVAFSGAFLFVRGEEAAPQWRVEIPIPISDSTPSPPVPKLEPINFEVLTSHTKQMDVTETPEIPDLPPIKGTINVSVQEVKNPGLPDPPPALPALPPTDPAVLARMEELRKNYCGTQLVFLSATVYDKSRTLLRIYPNGNVHSQISAWSNVDFNHFSGFSTFRVKASDGTYRDYGLLIGIGSIDTSRLRARLAQHVRDYAEPKIPELPNLATSGPSFVIVGGHKDGEAVDTLSQVHALYAKEGPRMKDAYEARVKAYAERKAYLLANPPVPEDVKIRFWKRK